METTSLTQQGNKLQAEFKITHKGKSKQLDVTSPQFICGSVFVQVKVISSRVCYPDNAAYCHGDMLCFIQLMKVNKHDHLDYTCKLSSVKLKSNLSLSDDSVWYKFHQNGLDQASQVCYDIVYSFDISVSLFMTPTVSQFSALYEDTDLADFELTGTDGSVKMHKFALASSSPVLRTMIQGEWKETAEGRVNVTGTTKQTLEHFRDYIYLQMLPDSGLEQLLLLASYYMMPELVQKCSIKLMNSLTAKNALGLIVFAVSNKLNNNFVLNILEYIDKGAIKVKDMSGYSSWNDIYCKEADTTTSIAK